MSKRKSLLQHWNEQSAWTQFRHMQRSILGLLLLVVGALFLRANPATGTFQEISTVFPTFNLANFGYVTMVAGLIVIAWWRAGFWTLFILALPIHFYLAFNWGGVFGGDLSGITAAFGTVIELQIFLCLWVAVRNERR